MGVHYASDPLVNDGQLDAQHPEALVYEPRDGQLHLVGVEYVVVAEAWDTNHPTPPSLLGQTFHYTTSPNRYGIPAFYSLHVWAWKPNPNGTFADWHREVSCDQYSASTRAQ